MHFWQAIKMAVKSLWTNKLRSFLTMLGIIIGVFTVALLTTVAQGVSSAVVSSIKSQSTLAVFVNISKSTSFKLPSWFGQQSELTTSAARVLMDEIQPDDEDSEDYFKYSFVYNDSTIISLSDVEIVSEDDSFDDILFISKMNDDSEENSENESSTQNQTSQRRNRAKTTQVYSVEDNFTDVYDVKVEGNFPKNENEVAVDDEFIKEYLPEVKRNEVIGQYITFGINPYHQIKIELSSDPGDENREKVINAVMNVVKNYNVTNNKLTIINNSNDENYSYDENSHTITVDVMYYVFTSTTDEIADSISAKLNEISTPSDNGQGGGSENSDNGIVSEYLQNCTVSISDKLDKTNAKTFKVVGIISEETNSAMSNMSSRSSSTSSNTNTSSPMASTMMNSLGSMIGKGTCYILANNENLSVISGENVTDENAKFNYIYLRYKTESVMDKSIENITLTFTKNGFGLMTQFMIISFSSVANIISRVMNILTIMLTVIAVISLIVGGIGIMNIMLVAVTERTREIGIRKAIGAKKGSILIQFLVEALMLSIFGGLIGLGISAVGTMIIASVMDISLSIPLWVVGMSVGFCTLIGLIFGMFPAVKASNMQPIDALRRE